MDSSELCDLFVLEIGPAVYATDVAALDLAVEKYGQTTRHTFGEITDADWSGIIGAFTYDDCFRADVTPPSADWSGGDSGSQLFHAAGYY